MLWSKRYDKKVFGATDISGVKDVVCSREREFSKCLAKGTDNIFTCLEAGHKVWILCIDVCTAEKLVDFSCMSATRNYLTKVRIKVSQTGRRREEN